MPKPRPKQHRGPTTRPITPDVFCRLIESIRKKSAEDGFELSYKELAERIQCTGTQLWLVRNGKVPADHRSVVVQRIAKAVLETKQLKATQHQRIMLQRVMGLEQTGLSPRKATRTSKELASGIRQIVPVAKAS